MLTNKENIKFFSALTGYRAIAAWMIFVYHFFPFKNENHNYPKWISTIIWEFHIGVDIFFVLSGFLITYRYFHQNPIDFKKYMVNRFARIYPMYFLITAAVFLVGFMQTGVWTSERTIEAVMSFTMIKALFSEYFFVGIPQGWTLTLEELFYFTAPFYFVLIRKKRWWIFVLPLIILAIGTALKLVFQNVPEAAGFLQKNISTYIIEFFTGIGLALLVKKTTVNFRFNWVTYFGISIILLYLVGMQYTRSFFRSLYDFGNFLNMGLLSIFGIAPLLWGLIYEDTIIKKILSWKTMVLLGKSSYIFYLIHKGFIPIFINDYLTDNKILLFIILNIISILLFRLVEEPLNHFIRKRYGSIVKQKNINR